jgi:hypothetical protein
VTETTFFQFLTTALDALEAEVPAAYARLCSALSGRTVRITVDGDTRFLRAKDGKHSLEFDGANSLEIKTNRAALADLLEARETLLDSVISERLVLRGTPDDVAALHDALTAFVQGAVRSRTLPPLLDAYLQSATAAPENRTSVQYRRRTGAERG